MESNSLLLELPSEILLKTLLFIPNLKNYGSKIKNVNVNLYNFIQSIFTYYNNKFSKIDKNWKYNIKKLKKLIKYIFLSNTRNDNDIIFLYYNIQESKKYIVYYAAYYNDTYLIDLLYPNNYYEIAKGAAKSANFSLLRYAIANDFKDYNIIAIYGAKGGHMDVVIFAIESGANDYNGIAEAAARYCHKNILQFAIKKGADNYNNIAEAAAKCGYIDIVKFAINMGADNDVSIGLEAATHNHLDIVKYILRIDSTIAFALARTAISNYNFDIADYIFNNYFNNYDEIINNAIDRNYSNIICYLIKKNINNNTFVAHIVYLVLKRASDNTVRDVIEAVKKLGIENYLDCNIIYNIVMNRDTERHKIIRYVQQICPDKFNTKKFRSIDMDIGY